MNLENIRYHIAVTLLVLGCSGLPTGFIVFCITEVIHIDEEHLNTAYLVTYVILVFFGLRFYIPRLRGFT
ncbi:hypothetical protein PspS04_07350 [Pseudomonas sp. S04]|nr:hypothetical protein PspS04_07350 [Pseudomonas sp. S04]QHF32681.1 hypothetical protein PspS19_07350 [Pseudomonas sp. S19]